MFKKIFMFCLFCLNILGVYATTVYIWEPDGENKYGHAAISTKTYHMSFWPEDGNKGKTVPGQLHYHVAYDKHMEGKRNPIAYKFVDICPLKVDSAYEDLLHYNDVTPDKVTINAGESKMEKTEDNEPVWILPMTKYNAVTSYIQGELTTYGDFYKNSHCCTSMAMTLLYRANPLLLDELKFFRFSEHESDDRVAYYKSKLYPPISMDFYLSRYHDDLRLVLYPQCVSICCLQYPSFVRVSDFKNLMDQLSLSTKIGIEKKESCKIL